MILDRLENYGKYSTLAPEIATAFEYLHRTDFSRVADGRYELEGDRVYALVQRYRPKPVADARWEAHRQYLDVQYLARGSEQMGCALLHDELAIQQDYDPQKDAAFYHANGELFVVPEGSFVIFAPQDVHAPGLAVDGSQLSGEVCKVVVKCRLPQP